MSRLNQIQKCILVLLVLVFGGSFLFFNHNAVQSVSGAVEPAETIRFSRAGGFYKEDIKVKLDGDRDTEIYYTLNGSQPEPGNAATHLYQEEIVLEAEETEAVYTLRAAGYRRGIRVSDVVSKTYILGWNVEQRYEMPVLAVSGNPEEFYNYENGIMVHGKMDDEYIAAHPEWADAFANQQKNVYGNRYQRGREAEKEVTMTLFDSKGNTILSQSCGFRLYGASSRMKNQPSFRLYARSEYDAKRNDFDYTFFDQQYTPNNTLQSKYKRIIVRNCGDDNGYGFIRSELATRIAREAGYQDAPAASPVCVYLNGNYYGVHWFVTNFDDTYFKEAYGEYTGKMYIFEGGIYQLELPSEEEAATYQELALEYNATMEKLQGADLQKEENWQQLNDFLDVEGFLKYTALQHYVGNNDCLFNNYRIYRYYAPDGVYHKGTVFDGRYRLLLFDLDQALGLIPLWTYIEPETVTLTAERADGDEAYEELFSNILKREDCKELYIRYYLSLMNYYYSEDYVSAVVDEMHGSRAAELHYMIHNTDLLLNNHAAPDITEGEYLLHQLFLIKRFAKLRPQYAKQDLELAFGDMTEYTLYLKNENKASVSLDDATLAEINFIGSYFQEVPLEITATARPGYEFSHWLVNGQRMEGTTFIPEASHIINGEIRLECVCVPAANADLRITAVKSAGGDYVEITNLGGENRNLGAYCLTDNSSVKKSTLPRTTLASGETITVYCKNYTEVEALGKPVTNFNIKAGETISLYRTEGALVDSVTVPEMGSRQGVWQMDTDTGLFKEVIR